MDLSGQELVVVVRGTLSNNTASIKSTRDHDLAAISVGTCIPLLPNKKKIFCDLFSFRPKGAGKNSVFKSDFLQGG